MEISFLFRITASGGGVVGNVYGWGCGNNQVQTGCVQGKTESKMLQKWNKLNSLKVAKWMKDEWRMNEGWKNEWMNECLRQRAKKISFCRTLYASPISITKKLGLQFKSNYIHDFF